MDTLGDGQWTSIVRLSPPRHSPPQTFTTSDIHHPQCKIRRSPPQTFTTPDVHHLRRSPPQTFTTPFVKSDVHHPRHSPPQTFTTPYSKMRHSPPTNIHHPLQSSPPKEKFTNRPSIQNAPAILERALLVPETKIWDHLSWPNLPQIAKKGPIVLHAT